MKFLGPPSTGSQDGVTAGRNRFGQYHRTRAVPVNPQSPAQGISRARFSASSSQWKELTSAAQQAWQDFADSTPVTDSLGQVQHLTGHQRFVAVNILRDLLGLVLSDTIPALPAYTGVLPSAAEILDGSVDLTLDTAFPQPASAAALNGVEIWATPPVSPGVRFSSVRNRLRLLTPAGVTPSAIVAGTPLDLSAVFDLVIGSLTGQVNKAVWFAVREFSGGVVSNDGGGFRPIRSIITET